MTDQASGSPQTVDYAALVKGARAGDKAAFTALYEATHKEIFRTIRAMVRTEDQALDIQQDAYVQAFTHLEQLTAPERFRPWMRSIAVNQTRLALRKQTLVLFSELSAEDEETSQLAEIADLRPEASPELHMERKECAAYVQEILDELTPGQRMLVGMYYYDQRPMREIADELSINLGTVKSQLSRTRKKIEAAVRQLEKKGVKLYGLSPLPFFFSMVRKLAPSNSSEKLVLDATLSHAGIVTEAVAVHVGRPFFETLVGKAVLGLVVIGVVGAGVMGYKQFRNRQEYGDVRPHETVETTQELKIETTETSMNHLLETPVELPPEQETTIPAELVPETTEPALTEPEEAYHAGLSAPYERDFEAVQPADAEAIDETKALTEQEITSEEPIEPEPETEEPTEANLETGLPTALPWPQSPGTVTIRLGDTWFFSGEGAENVSLSYYAVPLSSDTDGNFFSSSQIHTSQIHIGDHRNGFTSICFTPEQAGTYTIYVYYYGSYSNYGQPHYYLEWSTLIVTGGNE